MVIISGNYFQEQRVMQQNQRSLTAILSGLLEPQEDAGNFQLLFGELQQSGEPEDGSDTGDETRVSKQAGRVGGEGQR